MAAPGLAQRSLVILLALAVLAVGLTGLGLSRATYSTSSTSDVTATAVGSSDWLHLYSSPTDPDVGDRAGYATQNGVAPATWCATGQDDTLAVDWGLFPDANAWYTFTRAFTLRTVSSFPVSGVTQITVTATDSPPAGQQSIINSVTMAPVGNSGGNSSITLGVDEKCQINVRLRLKKQMGAPGDVLPTDITLTITYNGGPTGYYVVTVPTSATIQ